MLLVLGAPLLALAYLLPLLSVAVVWPILFVLPGWSLLAWSRVRLETPARLGVGVVLSVALTTHAVYWLGRLLGGYERETVFLAAAAFLPLIAAKAPQTPTTTIAAFGRAIWRHGSVFALAAITSVFVATVLGIGAWRVTPEGVSSGGFNWSDLLVHVSIAESLNAGNFPPEVPYFAGRALNYHWFSDFHAATAARSAGLFSVPVMIFSSSVLAGALVLLVHGLARRLLVDRRAALLAAVIAVFGGGLGYLRFFGDLGAGLGAPLDLISTTSYDNQWLTEWPYFRIPSVMGTGLLAHRATTAGLPMLVAIVLLLAVALPARRAGSVPVDRPRGIALAGVLTGLLAPFHFFFFPAALLLALLYVVTAGRLFDGVAPRNAVVFLAPVGLAIPFVLGPLATVGGGGIVRPHLWWDAPAADGPLAVAFFYLTNLGVPFVLAVAALAARNLPWRPFLLAWIVALFAIPNLVTFSLITFDMNKYFQAMWIGVALLAAWLIRPWRPAATAGVLALSVLSPLLVSAWYATSRLPILTTADLAAAEWARRETPERTVFVTEGWLHSFTDIAGRLRLLTYTPYVANLGYHTGERERQVHAIYCGGAESAIAVMRELGTDYVAQTRPLETCAEPTDFASHPAYELAFEANGLRVWHLLDVAETPP